MPDSPYINRFLQPDTLIPDPANPQNFNRYSYVTNNPITRIDNSGHFAIVPLAIVVGIVVVGWLAFAPPAYAPASEADLQIRTDTTESSAYTKTARWIDGHPVEYVAVVTLAVYATKETLTALGGRYSEEYGGPNSDTPVKTHPETKGENVKDTSVLDKWKEFLGDEPYSTKNPRTGEYDPDRITSSDGKRSIRYGDHETRNPNRHHYHEENWEYDAQNDEMNYYKRAIPILKTKFRK